MQQLILSMKDRKVLDECDGIKCIIMYTDYIYYLYVTIGIEIDNYCTHI